MLCNEGRRRALQAREERDQTRRRQYTDDPLHPHLYPFVPAHVLAPDHDTHMQLLGCQLTDAFDYQFRPRSLPDLTRAEHRLDSDPRDEKRKVKIQRNLEHIHLLDSDVDSDLHDIDPVVDQQDPIQFYRQACQKFQIQPLNRAIEGVATSVLDLSEMSISDLDLKVICLALRMHKKLKAIRLSANNITDQGCAYLQEALKDSYTIEELDVSKNPIRTQGLEVLSLLFANDEMKVSIIKRFNLSYCRLVDSDGVLLNKIIKVIEWKDAFAMNRMFKGGDMLEGLYLQGNQLGPIACKQIGSVLSTGDSSELRILDLSWNSIRDADIRPICNALKSNQSLQRLDLMMNGLGNQGAILLAHALSSNQSLMELDVSNNRIEKDGAAIFATKLELNRRLKKLWFGNNNIGTLGSLVLLKAIDHIQSQVEYLNVENILINDDFRDLYVQINQYLRPLEVTPTMGAPCASTRFDVQVPGFTIMDDIDLRHLDTKSLHAMFQRDPFKILGRMVKEGGFDFVKALKKWDEEEHGQLTYWIYVIDFPSAVKDAGIVLDKTLHFILWNYLKKVEKKGSVSYLQFITPLPKANLPKPTKSKQRPSLGKKKK